MSEKRAFYTCPECGTVGAEEVSIERVGERFHSKCGRIVTDHRLK